jgi:hypothetical protein
MGENNGTNDTVDGINPTPVDRWFILLFTGFQPLKVMQDFFHPLWEYGVFLQCGIPKSPWLFRY